MHVARIVPLLALVSTALAHDYPSCGGFRIKPYECPEPEQICIDDPYVGGCGMACDGPGICVTPIPCGGKRGLKCEEGKMCIDDRRDECNPDQGSWDCSGLCV